MSWNISWNPIYRGLDLIFTCNFSLISYCWISWACFSIASLFAFKLIAGPFMYCWRILSSIFWDWGGAGFYILNFLNPLTGVLRMATIYKLLLYLGYSSAWDSSNCYDDRNSSLRELEGLSNGFIANFIGGFSTCGWGSIDYGNWSLGLILKLGLMGLMLGLLLIK